MITYKTLRYDKIASIKPLWEALNRLHHEKAAEFKEYFGKRTFEQRIEKFRSLPEDRLFVGTAEDSGVIIGYVVATVSGDGTGEIDSIFVSGDYRTHGVGRALMDQALGWLSGAGGLRFCVGVAEGNEEVFGFYRRFGFYSRMTILARKGEGNRGGP
ncbi:MAG: GNAT family N-acetyltransferase [Deltaproteobacteria bacterium]|nr:GNAT family N-acetyltransferase [Candidatus Zymogenaceae bacterium]